jgi:protein-S-isoprenylcysteine O-methyltransferase Ste14
MLFVSKVWLGPLQILLLPSGELYAWTGAPVTVLGLALAVWARIYLGCNWSASIELKQSHSLIQTGPYRITRHPIYVGLLSAVLGTSITRGDIRGLIAFLLVLVAFFVKSRRENALLRNRFGDEYERYRRYLKPRSARTRQKTTIAPRHPLYL